MTRLLRVLVPALVLLLAWGVLSRVCAKGPTLGPSTKVTRVLVKKSAHTLTLFDGTRPVATYQVAIGPGGKGPKRREGDKITPVGRYHVVGQKPSKYRVFMRLDYPNAEDRRRFDAAMREGRLEPSATIGGDVGIHGAPPAKEWKLVHKSVDWTLGCVALDDDEIEEVAAHVPVGTPVDIED
jgi:murein L,D-transpeptidase YafK